MRFSWIIISLLLPFFLASCDNQEERTSSSQSSTNQFACIDCHKVSLDKAHAFPCTNCHRGVDEADSADIAHKGLVAHPAHPDNMSESCGDCHTNEVHDLGTSLHLTLSNMVNTFRTAFGAQNELKTFQETPEIDEPATILDLADDLLRRRCYRCHLYSPGDDYPEVHHGTGCAACHLSYYNGQLASHSFTPPTDQQCLSCHYGNYVGADYYGRFEHDFNNEYRTPYTTKENFFRPYGVEFHPLLADIHQKAGMLCIDCHSDKELMSSNGEHPSCNQCHDKAQILRDGQLRPSSHNTYSIRLHNGTEKILPLMKDPAHYQLDHPADCQVCHAQWSYNDNQKSYLRSDVDEYEQWSLLSVQGNSEIEHLLKNNTDFDKPELPPATKDRLTEKLKKGVWYKGYTTRRWENNILSIFDGKITNVRPLLDINLSWIDEDEEVHFDSVPPSEKVDIYKPYVPHTTGHAGIFYRRQINEILHPAGTEK